ncbi:hypothetical protein TELCIR_10218 [Teladorsagia circumcincta]|uniref:Phosphoribosyltransferase domain-containing protein n=1 Tax=Teladorsagia circumcincta TaxID=45464 RepID=A0A2G9UCQ0_TELCI|nr:hypothetical protein TELCIR_10218 [Teladorsagia circumcincta]
MPEPIENGVDEKAQKNVQIGDTDYCNSSGSSVNELVNGVCPRVSPSPPASRRRLRTMSGSKSEHHLYTTKTGRVLNEKEHALAEESNYNFDHPNAFDFDLLFEVMYGADVLIFEGILAFHRPEINAMMDMKPAFEAYIAPGMKVADIIVPRGGDNDVAINLIAKQVMTQLVKRGYDQTAHSQCRHDLVNMSQLPDELPDSLTIIRETPQVRGLHTFIRNKYTKRDELIFYSERLTRILVEEAMNFMPYKDVEIELNNGQM